MKKCKNTKYTYLKGIKYSLSTLVDMIELSRNNGMRNTVLEFFDKIFSVGKIHLLKCTLN